MRILRKDTAFFIYDKIISRKSTKIYVLLTEICVDVTYNSNF